MMVLQWLAGVLHREIDVDGQFGPQCVDLVNHWSARGIGLPIFVGATAAELEPAAADGWEWEANGAVNFPGPGAVVQWKSNETHRISAAGHVAVVLSADSGHLVTADQNWAWVPRVEMVLHDYVGVTGWWNPVTKNKKI